jgi:hypothetical protein
VITRARGSTALPGLVGTPVPAPPDEWTSARDRAAWLLETPALLLAGCFVLTVGLAMALITEELEGWLVAGAVVGLVILAAVRDSFKVWVALYPLAFLSPRFRLGEYAESGEKMGALQPWDVFAVIVVLLGLWRVWQRARLGMPPVLTAGVVLMLLFTLKAVRASPDVFEGSKLAVRCLFEPVLVFAAIASTRWTRVELRRVLFVLAVVGAVTGLAALVEFVAGGGQGRLESSWEGTNIQSAFLGALIPVTIGLVFGARSLGPVLVGAGSFLVMSLVVGLAMTRGVWLALGVGVGIMVTCLRAWLWAGLAAVLVVSVVLLAPPRFLERVESISEYQSQRSATNRLRLWTRVGEMVAERPLGYGIYTWKKYFHRGAEYSAVHSHSVLLDMGFAFGIPAVLTFLGLLGYVLLRATGSLLPWRATQDQFLVLGLGTGSLCLFLAGLTDGSITMWPILAHTFWFLLGLTWAATMLIREGEPEGARGAAAMPRVVG